MAEKYIECPECAEHAAINIGGNGTPESPWQWECTECEWVFTANDEEPDEKVWATPALHIPAVLVDSVDDLDLAVNHVRRVAALRCADLIRTTRAIRGLR